MNRKIYALAAAFVLAFSMSSCEEDDDELTYVAPDALSGRWVLDQVGSLNSTGALNYVSANDGCLPDEVTFDGDFFSTVVTTPIDEENCLTETKSGSWELVDGNLEFQPGTGDEFRRDVLTLTPEMMVLVYTNTSGEIEFLKYIKGL